MSAPPIPSLEKLAARRTSIFGAHALYLAPGHLLSVERTGWVEQYRRYSFADIQAVVIRRTRQRAVITAVLLILWPLAVMPFTPLVTGVWAAVVWAGAGAFFGALVLNNHLAGPTCRVWLLTSVSRARLPALARLRAAERFVAKLRPAVEQVQGALESGGIPEGAPPPSPSPEPTPVLVREETAEVPAVPVARRAENGVIHVALARLLPAIAAAVVVLPWAPALAAIAVAAGWIGSLVLVVVALVRQSGSDLPRGIQGWAWAVFAMLLTVGVATYFLAVGAMVIATDRSLGALISGLSQRPTAFMVFQGVVTLATLFASAWGLIVTSGIRRVRRRAELSDRSDRSDRSDQSDPSDRSGS